MNFLKDIWKAWKTFAHALGKVQTVILLTVFYFLILGPAALLFRLMGKSPLQYHRGGRPESYWLAKKPNARDMAQYYQQY